MTDMDRRNAIRLIAGALAGNAAYALPPAPTGAKLLRRAIPSTREMLPVIGLGTWQAFDVGPAKEDRAALEIVLRTFVDAGGSMIDSSPMYGRSEEVIGDITAQLGLRPRLFVATKVWTEGKTPGIRQMETSLRKLRVNPIDLMQVHNLVDMEHHLDTLKEWKRVGKTRYIGVTHYTAGGQDQVLRLLRAQAVDFIQINYSLGEREAERHLLPFAQEHGIAVIANRPFASGDLFRKLRNKPLPAWAADIDCGSWAQILLKFVISHPAITCAIPATANPAHVLDNMWAGVGRLPDQRQRAQIIAEL